MVVRRLFNTTTAEEASSAELSPSHHDSDAEARGGILPPPIMNQRNFDDTVVYKAVADAGRWAYGIVMVEVWLLSEDQTYLYRPDFSFWVDPIYQQTSDERVQKHLARLTDPSRYDYMPTGTLAIGEGLAGMLWVEAKNLQGGGAAVNAIKRMRETMNRRGSQIHLHRPASVAGPSFASTVGGDTGGGGGGGSPESETASGNNNAVLFRNVNQISADPDQPFSPRLKLIAELGLGWVAAVPIRNGIALYFARNHVSLQQLQSPANQNFLLAASRLIGAAFDLREPREVAEQARKQQVRATWNRVRDRIVYLKRMGIPLADAMAQAEQQHQQSQLPDFRQSLKLTVTTTKKVGHVISSRIIMMLLKCRGGGGMAPPALSWFQSCYTFVGASITLGLLHLFNIFLRDNFDSGMALGPFGALVTLLYCLSSAPASQPRNAIAGQVISILIGIAFTYATALPLWVRVNLATAFAVSIMAKLGVIHPPAGASAYTFASGSLGWNAMLVFLIGNVIAILAAMVINNLSVERQYPIYWGVGGACESLVKQRRRKDNESGMKKV